MMNGRNTQKQIESIHGLIDSGYVPDVGLRGLYDTLTHTIGVLRGDIDCCENIQQSIMDNHPNLWEGIK